MEEERGNVEVPTKVTEPLLTVPNPRAFQQTVVPPTPGQSKRTMFRTLETFDTEFSADSVEWCPAMEFRDTFVCGTYQLTKDEDQSRPSKRVGRIYLFRVIDHGELSLIQQLEVPAVLDMKWAHVRCGDRVLLGVANSIGQLQIYQLDNKNNPILNLVNEIQVCEGEDDCLALSLDWCSGKWIDNQSSDLQIVVSDSKGCVSLFEIGEEEIVQIRRWQAHNFEAWIAAFDYWNTNVMYSGGDDCKFKRFDTRIEGSPTAVSGIHNAGVTSIHSNATNEYLLSSGSYDEHLRLWDTRNFKRPVSQTDLGGGVWRLKWDPFSHRYLLAACMYGGFRLIDCLSTETPSIVCEYNEHESIAYGCDWSHLTPDKVKDLEITKAQGDILVGTCSFYDHILKLSTITLEEVEKADK